MGQPTTLRGFFSDATFEFLRESVVDVGRNIRQNYDSTFVRTSVHNFKPLVRLHHQLGDIASELYGQPLKPSYVFMSNYLPGGTCPVHSDRPQCEFTIDVLVASESAKPWPLVIADEWSVGQWEAFDPSEVPEVRDFRAVSEPSSPCGSCSLDDNDPSPLDVFDIRWNEILLEPNDAACYSGHRAWHYRPTVTRSRQDLVFFHFVPEAFDGSLS